MSDQLREQSLAAFKAWAVERGWHLAEIERPRPNRAQFEDATTDTLWIGWYAAIRVAAKAVEA